VRLETDARPAGCATSCEVTRTDRPDRPYWAGAALGGSNTSIKSDPARRVRTAGDDSTSTTDDRRRARALGVRNHQSTDTAQSQKRQASGRRPSVQGTTEEGVKFEVIEDDRSSFRLSTEYRALGAMFRVPREGIVNLHLILTPGPKQ